MAYLDTSYVQQTNIGAYVGGLSSYYTHRLAKFYIRTPSGSYGYSYESNMIGTNDSSSNVVNIPNLTPGTTYIVKAVVVNYYNGAWLWEDTIQVTTQSPPKPMPNPYSWSWNATEQNALYNRGRVSTITLARWNQFCEQVRNTSVWYHGYDPYNCNNAKMVANESLKASKFDILRQAIGGMNVDGSGLDPNAIARGKGVKGFYFIRLSERYNTITKPATYGMQNKCGYRDLQILEYEKEQMQINLLRIRSW